MEQSSSVLQQNCALIDLCRIEGSTLALYVPGGAVGAQIGLWCAGRYTPSVQPPYVDTVAQQNIEQQVSRQVVVVPKAQEKAKQYIDDYNDFLDNIPEEEEPPSMEELASLSTTRYRRMKVLFNMRLIPK